MNIGSFFELWNSILEFFQDIMQDVIVGAISFGVSYFTMTCLHLYKRWEIDTLLKMNQSDTYLSLPIRYGRINDINTTDLTWNYITFDEALVINEVQKLIDKEQRTTLILQDPAIERITYNRDSQDNLICIGGPMANDETAKYFRKGNPLHGIRFRWDNLSDIDRKSKFSEFIYLANENINCSLGEIKLGRSGKFEYQIGTEGYVMLVRLVGRRSSKHNDFADPEHGTVHIMFGVNAQCTLAAVRAFNLQSKALKQIVGKHKGHYVIIIKCTLNGESVELKFNDYYDFTDDVFLEN